MIRVSLLAIFPMRDFACANFCKTERKNFAIRSDNENMSMPTHGRKIECDEAPKV